MISSIFYKPFVPACFDDLNSAHEVLIRQFTRQGSAAVPDLYGHREKTLKINGLFIRMWHEI